MANTARICIINAVFARHLNATKEMANAEPRPVMTLRVDTINPDVLRLLMTLYTVIVEKINNDITLELYEN